MRWFKMSFHETNSYLCYNSHINDLERAMTFLNEFFAALYTIPLEQAVVWALAGNVVMFAAVLFAGEVLVRVFHDRANSPPPEPLSRQEIMLALVCVALNTLVAVIGIILWRAGIIQLHPNDGVLATLVDVAILTLLMDLGMYGFHRIAHHPVLYPVIHLTHHLYENPRPLTLFVLNPFEVLGFGALLILVILVVQASQLAIVIYLAFNLIFGLIGHLGVEPAPGRWLKLPLLRYVSTSTFHAEHHHDKGYNFGFYTVIWDKLFGTLSPEYQRDFTRATE